MRMKILYYTLCVVFLTSCSSKISYEEKIRQYNHLVSSADSLIKVKNYKQAFNVTSQAIKITDTFSNAFIMRGNALVGLQNYNDAIDDFSDAIKIEGEKSVIFKERANTYFLKNKKKKFLKDINHYIKYHNNDLDAYSIRADYYIEQKDYEKAVLDYSYCLKNDPENYLFYLQRGNVYALNEQNDLSISDYESYTRLNPNADNDQIFYKRAILNMKVNNFQKALDDFSLITNSNIDSKIPVLKADCFYKLNDNENAIENYSYYIEQQPDDYEVINKRGDSYFNISDFEKANVDFKTSASLKWKAKGVFYKYGWFLLFIVAYILIGLAIRAFFKEEYDNRKIIKSYLYYFISGLFGGHYLYLGSYYRYVSYSIIIFFLFFFNSFNIRSFYNHQDLLWSGVFDSKISSWTIYIILILFLMDLIFLSYFTFSKNHAMRISINDETSKSREVELNELASLLDKQNTKFKRLRS